MIDFAAQFKGVAEANFFEVVFADTLRVYPAGVPHRVLLEVEPLDGDGSGPPAFKLLQHRQPEWTAQYVNRTVSAAWIENFLQSNRGVAWFIGRVEALAQRPEPQSIEKTKPSAVPAKDSAGDTARIEMERAQAEEQARTEARMLEANAKIIAANIAAGLDNIEDGSRPVSYYEYFLANTTKDAYQV